MSKLWAADSSDGWRPATAQLGPDGKAPKAPRSKQNTITKNPMSCAPLPRLGTARSAGPPTRAMNRMIDHLVQRKAVLTKMFVQYDADNSGTIDRAELGAALADLGLRLSEEELDGVMSRLDSDGNGEVDLVEFMQHFRREQNKRFEGHVPELKEAKLELLKQLRSGGQLKIDGGSGLYKVLVQIERLQAVEGLTPAEVDELRRYIRELLQQGMILNSADLRKLGQAASRHSSSNTQNPAYRRPWKNGSWELPGPRLVDPHNRNHKRLSTAQWETKRWELKREVVPSHRTGRIRKSVSSPTLLVPLADPRDHPLSRTRPPLEVPATPGTYQFPGEDTSGEVVGAAEGAHHVGLWMNSKAMKSHAMKVLKTDLTDVTQEYPLLTNGQGVGDKYMPGHAMSMHAGEFARPLAATTINRSSRSSADLAMAATGSSQELPPPATPSAADVSRFLRFGLRPAEWQQATHAADTAGASKRWGSSAQHFSTHGVVAGGVWIE